MNRRTVSIMLLLLVPLASVYARAGDSKVTSLIKQGEAVIGGSVASATRALGVPRSTVREPRANTSLEGVMDEIITLTYAWGEASFYRTMIGSPHERVLPHRLAARAPIPQVAAVPAMGSSRSSVVDSFGSPSAETADTLYYARDEGAAQPQSLTFRFTGDRLTEVIWDFGVD